MNRTYAGSQELSGRTFRMKTKTWYGVVFAVLTAILLYDIVYPFSNTDTRITAVSGVFDARNWDSDTTPILKLNGLWRYSSGTTEIHSNSIAQDRLVPSPFASEVLATDTKGVYHLQILLPEGSDTRQYALNVESIFSSHSLTVNGETIMSRGIPQTVDEEPFALNKPYIVTIHPRQNRIDIDIVVVNQNASNRQGIIRNVLFGDPTVLSKKFRIKEGVEFSFAILFILVSFVLFLIRSSLPVYRGTVYLACFLFGLGCFILSAAPTHKLIYDILPITGQIAYFIQMRVYYISIISYVFFLFFLDQLFPAKIERIFLRVMGMLGIVLALGILLCSIQFVVAYETVIFSYRILALLGFTLMMVRIFRTDTSYVPYDLILMYFALFIFTTKNVFFYLRFNDESQTTYVELAIAVAVMIQIVLKKYRTVHQEQLKLALAFHNARIKPHFLFNALNSIHDAIYEEPQIAQKLLMAFSQFLRNRFRFTDFSALVPLSEELDILDAYLEIEHDRFRERIQIERQIDKNALDIRVPQLFLQPIVENAIHHGVLKQRRGGIVTIIIRVQADSTLVEVRDTGVGIQPERLTEIFLGTMQDSIGLANIHARLVYLYGKGLDIQSTPGEGTVVRCEIPNLALKSL